MKPSIGSYVFWISVAFVMGAGGVSFATKGMTEMASLALSGQLETTEEQITDSSLPKLTSTVSEPTTPNPSKEVSLGFVGDIMLDRGVKTVVTKYSEGDYRSAFLNMGRLKSADILFGNLEGPVSDRGRDLGNLYSFRMSKNVLPVLAELGFKVLSVANNHSGDWTSEAFADTLSGLDKYNISYVGGGINYAEATKPKIIEKNGLRIGYLGFTDVGPNWLKAQTASVGILPTEDLKQDDLIKQAAEQVDVLVVSYHFGDEYQATSNARQKKLARRAIDSGAKIVVGHHPHVPQEVEKYKDGLIAYSLGNFIFDQYFSTSTMNGLALDVKIKDGVVADFATTTVHISNSFQVSVN